MSQKDIFKSGCQVLVNPVNCVGVMGKGLALQFKNKYFNMYLEYRRDCLKQKGSYRRYTPGCCNTYFTDNETVIANIATKNHWMDKSKYEWVQKGIHELHEIMTAMNYKSVAIPRIGCGLGGLEWNKTKEIILNETKNAKYTIWLDGEIIEPKE